MALDEQRARELLNELAGLSAQIAAVKKKIEAAKNEKSRNALAADINITVEAGSQDKIQETDDTFEEEMSFYIANYRGLSDDFKDEELKALLPRRKNANYRNILLRLLLDSVTEMKYAKGFISKELSDSELKICDALIQKEKRKMAYIKSQLIKNEVVEEAEEENNIIVGPNVPDELNDIPREYYSGFSDLIKSIIDGTFKNVKMLTHDLSVVGIFEVKAFKIRVVFMRLTRNTYAIITAFMKKSDNDKLYRETLKCKIDSFLLEKDWIIANIDNPEYKAQNEENIQKMWKILQSRNIGGKQI